MKKLWVVLAAGICVGFFVGCRSTGVALSDNAPIAVITVSGNQSLPWKESDDQNGGEEEDDGTGALSTMVNKLLNGDSVEMLSAQDRLDYAADSLIRLLEENSGAEVVDKDVLLSSDLYLSTKESVLNFMMARITATNYKNLSSIGAKRSRMIMHDMGAKSLLFVDFVFQKELVSGNKWTGELCAHVEMEVRYLNERGKEIINRVYKASSMESLRIANRKYDKDALVALFPDTIDTVISHFIVDNL